MSFNPFDIRRDESGTVALFALLLSAAATALYVVKGSEYLKGYPEHTHTIVLIAIAALAFFSLASCIHLVLLGNTSKQELRDEARNFTQELKKLCLIADKRLQYIESCISGHTSSLSSRGLDCLDMAQKISDALHRRLSHLELLLSRNSLGNIMQAHSLMLEKLIFTEDSYTTILNRALIPELAPEHWESTLERLFEEINLETYKRA